MDNIGAIQVRVSEGQRTTDVCSGPEGSIDLKLLSVNSIKNVIFVENETYW